MKDERGIVILGAGLAGLSAAYYLKDGYEIFEKEDSCGGLCRSRCVRGFTFDIAGHLLHFKDKKNLIRARSIIDTDISGISRKSWIWVQSRFIRYPFQSNLHGLESRVISDCIAGFKKAREKRRKALSARHNHCDFKTWLLQSFGEGMSRHFLFPYNKKFWKFPLERLSDRWAREWIYVPSLKEVMDGANNNLKKEVGYNAKFWYPREGGIQALVDSLERRIKRVRTLSQAVKLDLVKKEVLFKEGNSFKFKKVISTIPLPELAKIIDPLPDDVRRAFLKLKYVSVLNLNLGISGNIAPDKHWIYFPQKDVSFYRMGVASNFSAALAPKGCSTLYFEISYSKDHPYSKDYLLERVLADCRKVSLDLRREDVLAADINDVKYAYCVYDDQRDKALEVIRAFLNKHGIFSIGRYGGWRYASMEDVMSEARHTAATILSQ